MQKLISPFPRILGGALLLVALGLLVYSRRYFGGGGVVREETKQ